MFNSQGLLADLASQRHGERYRQGTAPRIVSRGGGPLAAARDRAGWLLVGIGLRLALPGRRDGARLTGLMGR